MITIEVFIFCPDCLHLAKKFIFMSLDVRFVVDLYHLIQSRREAQLID